MTVFIWQLTTLYTQTSSLTTSSRQQMPHHTAANVQQTRHYSTGTADATPLCSTRTAVMPLQHSARQTTCNHTNSVSCVQEKHLVPTVNLLFFFHFWTSIYKKNANIVTEYSTISYSKKWKNFHSTLIISLPSNEFNKEFNIWSGSVI